MPDFVNTFFEERVEQLFDLPGLAERLFSSAGLEYRIAGGLAAYLYVEEAEPDAGRLTKDIDIVVRRADLERIANAAASFGLQHRHVAGVDMLVRPDQPSGRRAIHLHPEPTLELGLNRRIKGLRLIPLGDLIHRKLPSRWAPGVASRILSGALMAFQSVHGLTMDGVAGVSTWQAVLDAATKGQDNPNGYTYAYASKASPETLTIYHDGKAVMHVLANTGIAVAPTVDGTYPVYLRYRNQIMKGTNPDGTKYADPVQFVAYFNGGDAVHYF